MQRGEAKTFSQAHSAPESLTLVFSFSRTQQLWTEIKLQTEQPAAAWLRGLQPEAPEPNVARCNIDPNLNGIFRFRITIDKKSFMQTVGLFW